MTHIFDKIKSTNIVKFDQNIRCKKKSLIIIVWNVINNMLFYCQQTIKKYTRYFLRMKIVRNEIKQIKYRSLQLYINSNVMKDYVRL